MSHPRRHRLARLLSTLCLIAGVALAADVVVTLLWQEPVTAAVALLRRADLDERYARRVMLDPAARATLASIHAMDGRVAFLAAREAATVPAGAALGTIAIPRIGARYQLIQGTSESSLALGPGHYSDTDLPGQGGVVAVAGHRTTFLAPFREINELAPGDVITLDMPYGHFTYAVTHTSIVAPTDWAILRPTGGEELVLSSCNPLFSAAQRIVVFARLAALTPAGAALEPVGGDPGAAA